MANFLTSVLTKYQAKITQQLQSGELRARDPKVFNFMRRSTEIMIPSHAQIKAAIDRTTGEVNYFKRSSRSLGTAGETYNHTGTKGDSAVLVPEWAVRDDKFYYSLKQANKSAYSLEEEIMSEMTNINLNFSEGLEAYASNYLFSNKSGVNVYARQGTFNGTTDAFEIVEDTTSPLSTGYRAIQISKSAMDANKWGAFGLVAICDTMAFDKFEALANNGSGNSINTSFQFSGVEFIKSVEMDALATALGYTKGYWLFIPMGQVSMLDWVEEQYRNGVVGPDNRFGTIIHPQTGLTLSTHEYSARANETSNGGKNQDVKTEVQVFANLSPNVAPLSVADETPIQAFALTELVEG